MFLFSSSGSCVINQLIFWKNLNTAHKLNILSEFGFFFSDNIVATILICHPGNTTKTNGVYFIALSIVLHILRGKKIFYFLSVWIHDKELVDIPSNPKYISPPCQTIWIYHILGSSDSLTCVFYRTPLFYMIHQFSFQLSYKELRI